MQGRFKAGATMLAGRRSGLLGRTWFGVLFALPALWVVGPGGAQAPVGSKPTCPPGYKVVEEIVMKEQPRFCCEVVPKIKKKWVYESVDDGFCIPHTPLHQPGCDKKPHCRNCTRQLLVKKQIEICDGYKCEVKKTMEQIPCRVYRVVPCTEGLGQAGQAGLAIPPPATGPDGQLLRGAQYPTPSNAGIVPAPAPQRTKLLPYFLIDRREQPPRN
ncbi:MAG: hypothetical protein FJ271_00115 [Planctomycetes bacterium]|nr:hypothetical protein [Planctomycetota bacterium]